LGKSRSHRTILLIFFYKKKKRPVKKWTIWGTFGPKARQAGGVAVKASAPWLAAASVQLQPDCGQKRGTEPIAALLQ
jgi:hypothetical protein